MKRPPIFVLTVLLLTVAAERVAGAGEDRAARDLDGVVLPFVDSYCIDCHDSATLEGGFDLERFVTLGDALDEREVWLAVYEKIESHQMPPPKRKRLPDQGERDAVLAWIEQLAALPAPGLGARDPGRPVIRRLNRLEYNNTVRDLVGLDTGLDIFLFSERLPVRKGYFDTAAAALPDHVEVNVREYGAKAPALLPQAGLPGENRAAHGYNNRGDAMNVSPLLLEKYVALAGEIAGDETLPHRSEYFAALIGVDPDKLPKPPGLRAFGASSANAPVDSGDGYATNGNVGATAAVSDLTLEEFRARLEAARAAGAGGVFDVPAPLANQTVAGKGGLVHVRFGLDAGKALTVNPNADLWLVPFATADETSGDLLIANREKGSKDYELTFDVKDGGGSEVVRTVACCLLARRGESGAVTVTATMEGGSTVSKELELDGENVFVAIESRGGFGIQKLRIDGSRFSGDYVLVDDLGFITDGSPPPARANQETREEPEVEPPAGSALAEIQLPEPPAGAAPERIRAFLDRAFRRPAQPAEVERYLGVYEGALADGLDEPDAVREVVRAALASPSFLFIEERPAGDDGVRALGAYELANRLSYWLWSSMPDPVLMSKAADGSILDPEMRAAEVQRMVRDPKARELSESFAVQWLRLDQLYTAQPDRDLFRSFYRGAMGKDTLHASMLVEVLLLFETVLLEDRAITDLIDPGFGWLNPRLIRHYGLEDEAAPALLAVVGEPFSGVTGPDTGNRELPDMGSIKDNQWFRVALADKTRGGVMTMGGPLTVTSLPFRTSPVKRGAWLLETVFNRPPSEPKVAFAIEDDTKEAAAKQSVRQKFEAHRNKAACYSCHIRLDPPGFALERFDAVGAWRDRDGPDPVDARGEWGGVPFDGPAEYKTLLSGNPHEFTRGFIEHLLSYALGRELGIADLPTVQEIQALCAGDGNRFGRLLAEIANSYPFTHVR